MGAWQKEPRKQRKRGRFELRLSLYQLVFLVGLLCGSIFVSFWIGYSSGQYVGFQIASNERLTQVARVELPYQEVEGELSEKISTEVYAQLGKSAGADDETDGITTEDTLEPIVTDRGGPAVTPASLGEVARTLSDESPGAKQAKAGTSEMKDTTDTVVPAAGKPQEKRKTLAALLPKDEELGIIVSQSDAIHVLGSKGDGKTTEAAGKGGPQKVELPVERKSTQQEPSSSSSTNDIRVEREAADVPEKVADAPLQKGWYAQVAAPKDLSEARGLAGKLHQSGFASTVEVANVRGEKYFRVLVGPETNRVYAERLVQQLRGEPYISGTPFVKMVR